LNKQLANEVVDEDEYLDRVFDTGAESYSPHHGLKTQFLPWHHPVKQIVRKYQWGNLTKRLFDERTPEHRGVLRYFSLPGKDLLDIRYLSDRLGEYSTKIEYFGFDSSLEKPEPSETEQPFPGDETALRQVGKITDNSIVLPDRLEDISEDRSQAAERLAREAPFDVVNIDACNHLTHIPTGRTKNLFAAFHTLLSHQFQAKQPWLLFLTTRVGPEFLGQPGEDFRAAIRKNIDEHPADFPVELGKCMNISPDNLDENLEGAWDNQGDQFLRAYSIGLAKHLLQFFHGQGNFQAKLHLNSVYCYRVVDGAPDMLSFAFTITPQPIRVNPPAANGQLLGDPLELGAAKRAIARVQRIWDLDDAIGNDDGLVEEIVEEAEGLLSMASYSIPDWKEWVRGHAVRPIAI
tara:strand:+ start:1543 stop:2757 length:1215 start_codon:yes stop_codon:yes gene_type:complete